MEKNLSRFVDVQNSAYAGYAAALDEFKRFGRKSGHWIWYIFPQLEHEFPGRSSNNQDYGIQGLEEAYAYMADEILCSRLLEISSVVLALEGNDPEYVMGSRIDAKKLRSCMTLFSVVAPEHDVFAAVLEKYFGGRRCDWTLAAIEQV